MVQIKLHENEEILLPISKTINNKTINYSTSFDKLYDVNLVNNDIEYALKQFKSMIKPKLIVTSPPYNVGKPYEKKVEFKKYLQRHSNIIHTLCEVLDDAGSICWQVGNYIENGEVFPLDIFFYQIFKDNDMILKNRIIWHVSHGLHEKTRLSGRYETILWFVKNKDYTFNLDSIRVPQKYPGKRAYKGPNKGKPSGNPLGKNPSDIWEVVLNDWEDDIWKFPNVKASHIEKTIHPAQYPIELVERLVLALTNEGDIVLDPYAGVGSSLVAALLYNRKSIGVDIHKEYTDIAFNRLLLALKGKLKRRPIDRKPYQSPKNSKLIKIPDEWKQKN